MSAIRWLIKCGAAAAIVLIACGFATVRFGSGLQMPATTTRDGTLITLGRYLREPVPDIVLLGSSITFASRRNISQRVAAESGACRGLSGHRTGDRCQPAAASAVHSGRGECSRPTHRCALVERYSRGETEPFFFRPVRAAVAAYEQRLHAPLTHEQVAFDLRRLVGQPPGDFDNRIYVDRALQQFNAEDPADAARLNAKRIGELIGQVEQRGARVFLFELPYAEPIEGSRFAATTREIIHAAFPDSKRWLPIEVDRSELRWADGVHLDERSAVIVTQAMERALASVRAMK